MHRRINSSVASHLALVALLACSGAYIDGKSEDRTREREVPAYSASEPHIFLPPTLVPDPVLNSEIALHYEDLLREGASRFDREWTGRNEDALLDVLVAIWITEGFWIDGLRHNRHQLLDALPRNRRAPTLAALLSAGALDGDIAYYFLTSPPLTAIERRLVKAEFGSVAPRPGYPCSYCISAYRVAVAWSLGELTTEIRDDFLAMADAAGERDAAERLLAIADGGNLDWDSVSEAGCWD